MINEDHRRSARFHSLRDVPGWLQVLIGLFVLLFGSGIALKAFSTSPRPTPTPTSTPTPRPRPKTPVGLTHPVYLDVLPETTGGQVTPGQVSIGGHSYQHGIQFEVGTGNETVEASYSIPTGAQTFSTAIGNDDNQPNELWSAIPLLYEVLVDGRRVATGHARGRAHDPPLNAEVSGGSTITLKVTDVHDQTGSTRVDWANPMFR